MKRKIRLIYTICYQDGEDHWSQGFQTVDAEIELPETLVGGPINNFSFVGLEFLPEPPKGE